MKKEKGQKDELKRKKKAERLLEDQKIFEDRWSVLKRDEDGRKEEDRRKLEERTKERINEEDQWREDYRRKEEERKREEDQRKKEEQWREEHRSLEEFRKRGVDQKREEDQKIEEGRKRLEENKRVEYQSRITGRKISEELKRPAESSMFKCQICDKCTLNEEQMKLPCHHKVHFDCVKKKLEAIKMSGNRDDYNMLDLMYYPAIRCDECKLYYEAIYNHINRYYRFTEIVGKTTAEDCANCNLEHFNGDSNFTKDIMRKMRDKLRVNRKLFQCFKCKMPYDIHKIKIASRFHLLFKEALVLDTMIKEI